jgi:L-cysteine S-thiosulfotransferase
MRTLPARALLLVAGLAVLSLGLAAFWPMRGADEPARGIPLYDRHSGRDFLSAAAREEQDDLTRNPGMLWVDRGAELWRKPEGAEARSCASCHGEPSSLRGVAARYPVWDAKVSRLLTLEGRIQQCRAERQRGQPLAIESQDLLALTVLAAHQSRGLPVHVSIDGPARRLFDAGQALYYTRQGQLNLSCAQCHEQNWGKKLRAETLSQGQSNGYPTYRLEWQTLGSLYRRLRSCYAGVRAEPPPYNSPEHLGLELYLAWRAEGLPIEAPALRR